MPHATFQESISTLTTTMPGSFGHEKASLSVTAAVAGNVGMTGPGGDELNTVVDKLTMDNFDPISDQIIALVNQSQKEKDGRTLIQVIRLIFDRIKTTDGVDLAEMYARLCRKMMDQISPMVQDDGIRDQQGKPIGGGQLFCKYLLNRCQEDFERECAADDEPPSPSSAEQKELEDEVETFSEEYHAPKAMKQGIGVVKFIGELFKFQMLTERILHECVKKLLGNVENPDEEELESLCILLTTVGHLLDTPKAQGHMDIYFSRMEQLCMSRKVPQRLRFRLQVSLGSMIHSDS